MKLIISEEQFKRLSLIIEDNSTSMIEEISRRLLSLSELPVAPPNVKDKYGRIIKGKVHLYHSTNGVKNLHNIVNNGIDFGKQVAVEGLFFAKLGSPYREGDSFVVLEMDIEDVPWGSRVLGSEVAFGQLNNYKVIFASELSPNNMKTIKFLVNILKRDGGLLALEQSLDNYSKYPNGSDILYNKVMSIITDVKGS